MFRDYSEFFEEDSHDGQEGIRLRAGKSRKDLIVQFRGYLALDVLMALVDERSVSALGGIIFERVQKIKGSYLWIYSDSYEIYEWNCRLCDVLEIAENYSDKLFSALFVCCTQSFCTFFGSLSSWNDCCKLIMPRNYGAKGLFGSLRQEQIV